MAVDMSGQIVQAQPPQQGVLARIQAHPYISIAIGLFIAVVIGYIINTVRGGQQTGNQPGTSQGLPTTDASGNKVYYVPTSNTFLDYNNVQGSYNATTTNTTTTTTTNNSDVDHEPSPEKVPAPTNTGSQKQHPWTCTVQVQPWPHQLSTLFGIAERYLGNGALWHQVYSVNQQTIDSIARQHGNPIPGGPWNNVFPGEVLHVPCGK